MMSPTVPGDFHIDIGIDSSSTESVSTDEFMVVEGSAETLGQGMPWWPIFRSIASGTELVVRGECDTTADALAAAIYGVS